VSEPIAEHDVVVLTRDVPDEGLQTGDLGVVLLVHQGDDQVGPGFTIEVTTVLGDTIAVTDVPADLVRPVTEHDVRHTRSAPSPATAR
jgi:hypothetical protein